MGSFLLVHSCRYKLTLLHNREVNESEINATRNAFVENMRRAMTNHINTMKSGGRHDLLCVFRLVAIWFDNESRDDIRAIIKVEGGKGAVSVLFCIYEVFLSHFRIGMRLSGEVTCINQSIKVVNSMITDNYKVCRINDYWNRSWFECCNLISERKRLKAGS